MCGAFESHSHPSDLSFAPMSPRSLVNVCVRVVILGRHRRKGKPRQRQRQTRLRRRLQRSPKRLRRRLQSLLPQTHPLTANKETPREFLLLALRKRRLSRICLRRQPEGLLAPLAQRNHVEKFPHRRRLIRTKPPLPVGKLPQVWELLPISPNPKSRKSKICIID